MLTRTLKSVVHVQLLLPAPQLAHGVPQHPVAQVHDHPGLFSQRDERIGHQQAALRVVPAHQRLNALDPAGRKFHHRLVVQGELVLADRLTQFGDHDALQPAGVEQCRFEHLDAAVRLGLGGVHRGVRFHDQIVDGLPGFRDPQADAGAAGDAQVPDFQALAEGLEDPVGDPACPHQVGLRQHHGEFVAAEAGDRVRVADGVLEPPRDHPEDVVAGAVAQRVVDALEGVEVEDQQRRRQFAPGRLGKGVAQDRVERRPVGKLGQRVGQRHPLELDLGFAQHRRPAFDAFLEFLVDGLQVVGHQVDPGDDRGDVVPGTGVREYGWSGHRRRSGRCLRRGRAAWGPADQSSLVYCPNQSMASASDRKNCAGMVSVFDRSR